MIKTRAQQNSLMQKQLPKKLHIGCGTKYLEGWLNIDNLRGTPDKKIDLEKFPWPLPSDYFEEVYCSHVLEHLSDVQKTMDEIWRCCAQGAIVMIKVPHFSSMAAPSPFHKHSFNSQAMNYFSRGEEKYGKANFRILSTRIFWYPDDAEYVSHSSKRKIASLVGKFLDFFINLNRSFFERVWLYYVGGAFEIEWKLKVEKKR